MSSPERFDTLDLDAIIDLMKSPGYALVARRINEEIERKRTALEQDGDPDRLRGEIAGLRLALEIPAILKQEIRQQV